MAIQMVCRKEAGRVHPFKRPRPAFSQTDAAMLQLSRHSPTAYPVSQVLSPLNFSRSVAKVSNLLLHAHNGFAGRNLDFAQRLQARDRQFRTQR